MKPTSQNRKIENVVIVQFVCMFNIMWLNFMGASGCEQDNDNDN